MSKPIKTESLTFTKGNAKIEETTLTFSLPTGHTCPFAQDCLAKVNPTTGRVTDGKKQKFRCFSASMEAAFSSVRKSRWKNLRIVKEQLKQGTLTQTLLKAIPQGTHAIRIHVGGDFFSQDYFDAWAETARQRPETIFYAYTKSIPYWRARFGALPDNFRLTASMGGKEDQMAKDLGLPTTIVVTHPNTAVAAKLEIDHDDSHPMAPERKDFALLLHGMQPKGSIAAQALALLRKTKIPFGYPKAA